jgi:hypothetical protein
MTVREGWVVFFVDSTTAVKLEPMRTPEDAWDNTFPNLRRVMTVGEIPRYYAKEYTCRRVRVTIETIDELEQEQSDG